MGLPAALVVAIEAIGSNPGGVRVISVRPFPAPPVSADWLTITLEVVQGGIRRQVCARLAALDVVDHRHVVERAREAMREEIQSLRA